MDVKITFNDPEVLVNYLKLSLKREIKKQVKGYNTFRPAIRYDIAYVIGIYKTTKRGLVKVAQHGKISVRKMEKLKTDLTKTLELKGGDVMCVDYFSVLVDKDSLPKTKEERDNMIDAYFNQKLENNPEFNKYALKALARQEKAYHPFKELNKII